MHQQKADLVYIKQLLQQQTGVSCGEVALCLEGDGRDQVFVLEAVFIDSTTDEIYLTSVTIPTEEMDEINSGRDLTVRLIQGIVEELTVQMKDKVTMH